MAQNVPNCISFAINDRARSESVSSALQGVTAEVPNQPKAKAAE
jgi:hypothetical protein